MSIVVNDITGGRKMKIRSFTLLILLFTIILTLTSSPAFAGGRHHERRKGIAIGLGAAILGNAIINNSRDYSARDYGHCAAVVPGPPRHYSPYEGRWEIRDEWVPPTYKTVWNPAHYNTGGDWVEGAWIRIEGSPGYWKQEKVWVAPDVSNRGY